MCFIYSDFLNINIYDIFVDVIFFFFFYIENCKKSFEQLLIFKSEES